MAEKIERRIIEDTEKEVEAIIADAESSAKRIIEEASIHGMDDARQEAEDMLKVTKDEAEALKRQIVTEARMKADWNVLSKKQELVERVLNESKKALLEWADFNTQYTLALRDLIIQGCIELGGGDLKVLLNKRDSKLDLSKLSNEVEKMIGKKTNIDLGEVLTTRGAIIKTSDGKMTIDNSFDGIIERQKRSIEVTISNILFKE